MLNTVPNIDCGYGWLQPTAMLCKTQTYTLIAVRRQPMGYITDYTPILFTIYGQNLHVFRVGGVIPGRRRLASHFVCRHPLQRTSMCLIQIVFWRRRDQPLCRIKLVGSNYERGLLFIVFKQAVYPPTGTMSVSHEDTNYHQKHGFDKESMNS